jgi:hypothetical protein
MAKANSNRITYNKLLKLLIDFNSFLIKEPPLRETLILSKKSNKIIRKYYSLKREIKRNEILSPNIQQLINNLPVHVWLLQKYVMESILTILTVCLIIPYLMFIPTFRGQFSFFIGGVFLIWYFLRRAIYNLNSDLNYFITELIKEIKKELNVKY